jgi:Uncharacterized conserved protein
MSKRLVVALSGGVGGAKLALGLSRVLPADELLVVANTGDDFEHLGLSISPDIDTLTYVLAASTIPPPAGAGVTRRGRSWTASARSAARTGFGSAIAISRCMSSAPVACAWGRHCPR